MKTKPDKTNNKQSRPRHIKSMAEMEGAGFVDKESAQSLAGIEKRYTIGMSTAMQEAARKAGGAKNAITRQFVPSSQEMMIRPLEQVDPIGDDSHSPLPGLVHRHADRVLIMPTMACAVYCRFCFRREKVGHQSAEHERFDFAAIYAYIRQHPDIKEVILTGGDPMVLSARNLGYIIDGLNKISHVKRIRIHSRVPMVRPEMMTEDKIALLAGSAKKIWFSLHVDSAEEFTPAGEAVLQSMQEKGIPLVSQTVFLKDVNDNVPALARLFDKLLEKGIKPYYIHHPDKAVGTGHFRISLEKGMTLMAQLRDKISGLAVPDYVLDIPGGVASKVPLYPGAVRLEKSDENTEIRTYTIISPTGKEYSYQDDAF